MPVADSSLPFLELDWPVPPGVRVLITTRTGGVSTGPYASFNLGDHVGDDPAAVVENRARLGAHLPQAPIWLRQVHGTEVADCDLRRTGVEADASVTQVPGRVLAILTADCLPVLMADDSGSAIAIAHAGWRGLAAGVVERTVASLRVGPERVVAFLGPAIGPDAFEVGNDVRSAFLAGDAEAAAAFVAHSPGKWRADLCALARMRLAKIGVTRAYGGGFCTFSAPTRFFSHRRDGVTGRMASLIWIEPDRREVPRV
jgi:hypothetical protein